VGFLDRLRRPSSDAILERELLVPTADTGRPPGAGVLEADTEVPFVVVADDDGSLVLPAFTSEEALTRWMPQGSPYIALQGRALVEILARSEFDRIVVDGADGHALALTRSAAQELIGVIPVPAGATFRLGQPAVPPPAGLVEAVRRACERELAIREAYLYQFQIPERDEPPSLAVGLVLDESVREPEAERIARSLFDDVDPSDWGHDYVDLHPLSGELLDAARASGIELVRRAPRS
jgi:SseB protein N-terminal domain/SseB protein C-terminal domain